MIRAALIQRLPRLTLRERCRLFAEIRRDNPTELSPGRVEEFLERYYLVAWDSAELFDQAAREVEWLQAHQGGIIAFGEKEYPSLLQEIYDPPFALYFRGSPPPADAPFVAVVGTRRPNGRGRRCAFELGEDLGRRSIPVVSGLARGIDRQAHEGNLSGGGATVAVLGSGIAEVGPVSSRPTAEKLLEAGGAVVSEYPVFTHAQRHFFPMRNRIISGMSRCSVIVQAPSRSGALITADYALDQGREVFVHEACLQPGVGDGCRALAFDGARTVACADDITRDWEAQWGKVS